ncbi:MAG: GspH/FimT family pseudopilin [Tepidimonas sp.]
MKSHTACPSPGFTLIEMMVTVAVLAIILAIGVPNLQGFIASSRLRSATQDLYGALQTARAEAIRRNTRVTVCKADATLAACQNGGDWHGGWIVFIDRTPGTAPNIDSTDTVLLIQPAANPSIQIRGNGRTNGPATYVSYTADGASKQLNGAFLAGTIRVCSTSAALSNDNRARNLVINASGRIVAETPTGVASTCPAP